MQVALGSRTFQVSPIKLGAAKEIRAELLLLLSMKDNADKFPTPEQLDAMITVVYVGARTIDPAVTREEVAAAVDDLDLLDGMTKLSQCASLLIAPRGGSTATGEADSPATSSTSSGSMESSSPQPDGTTLSLTT